jgi:predicted protein tyrosine phosphatase
MKVLFVCSQNVLRSPTAEAVFSPLEGLEVLSAGTDDEAECPISADLIEWAEIIFVMERVHQQRLTKKFGPLLRDKRLIVLGIPDNYEYMDPELVEILKLKVSKFINVSW